VVGALLVAFDLSEFDRSLERMVADARFFDSGGVYLLDPRAGDARQAALVLPAALRGRSLSQVLPGAAGPALLAACVRRRRAPRCRACSRCCARRRRPLRRRAAGRRLGLAGGRRGVARRALQSHWRTLAPFLALFGVAALALCAGQYGLMRRWVGQPLRELTRSLERVAAGDLSASVDSRRRDDIGALMCGVERMRQRYVQCWAPCAPAPTRSPTPPPRSPRATRT
jgi:methyl-accepting chemotaxis protein-2 (aspartate sensor receptor)